MKNKSIFLSPFLLFLSLFLAGCASDSANRPALSPVSEKVHKVGFAGTVLEFDLTIPNSDTRGMAVQGYTYKLLIAGREFRGDKIATKSNVPAGEIWQRSLELRVNIGELDVFLRRSKHTGASVPYELSGQVHVVDQGGNRKLPFRVRGEITLLRKPEFAMENLRVENLTAAGAMVKFDLVVKNTNSFAATFRETSVDLSLEGQTFTQQKEVVVAPVAAGTTTKIAMILEPRFELLGQNARRILEKKQVTYALVGRATFTTPWGDKRIEFERGGSVRLVPLF